MPFAVFITRVLQSALLCALQQGHKACTRLLVIGCSIFVPHSLASQSIDLFTVTLSVQSDSRAQRQQATSEALKVVYQRVSGSDQVIARYPGLATHLSRASQFLQTYAYGDTPSTGTNSNNGTGNEPSAAAKLQLTLRFSPDAIKAQFRELQVPYWGAQRPLLTAMMVVQQAAPQGTGLEVSDFSSAWLRAEGAQAASEIGLPVRFDSPDRRVQSERIMREGKTQMLARAQSSGNEATLLGQITQLSSGQWRADWTFYWDGTLAQQTSSDQSFQNLLRQGFGLARKQFASQLATPLAVVGQGGSTVQGLRRISLSGVSSIEDYFKLTRYLDSVEGFKGYQIAEINRSTLSIDLPAQLSTTSIKRLLAASGLVAPVDSVASRYRWTR